MQFKIKNLILSISLANFMALNLFMLFVVYLDDQFQYTSFAYQLEGYVTVFGLFLIFGTLVSLAAATCIGVPFYYWMKKIGQANLVTSVLGGVTTAVIPLLICWVTGWNLPALTDVSGALLIANIALCGGMGGWTFWKLSQRP